MSWVFIPDRFSLKVCLSPIVESRVKCGWSPVLLLATTTLSSTPSADGRHHQDGGGALVLVLVLVPLAQRGVFKSVD